MALNLGASKRGISSEPHTTETTVRVPVDLRLQLERDAVSTILNSERAGVSGGSV